MEAGVDFAEDDVPVLASEIIFARIADVRSGLAELERSFSYGKLVHEGLTLAIVGRLSRFAPRLRQHAFSSGRSKTGRESRTAGVRVRGRDQGFSEPQCRKR